MNKEVAPVQRNTEVSWSHLTETPQLNDPAVAGAVLKAFRQESDFANCLLPLLTVLKWKGNPRHIAESLPHFAETLDMTGFRNVMARLHFSSRPERLKLGEIDPRLIPCVFIPDDGAVSVLLGNDKDGFVMFNGDTAEISVVSRMNQKGIALFFEETDPKDSSPVGMARLGWFRILMQRFRPLVWQIFIVTLFMNIMSLATPLFVMGVYDKVVSSGSLGTLTMFVIGVVIALISDQTLRALRARILAYVGARLDNILGSSVFERILYLPPTLTERATIGAQVARIKDFESIREFFTGPLAVVIIELPFTIFYIAVISLLGGFLIGMVPLAVVALFGVLGAIMFPIVKQTVSDGARGGSDRNEFVVETLSKMRSVKYTGAEARWLERYREMSSKSSMSSFKISQVTALVSTFAHILVMLAGIAVIALGVYEILAGTMSVGAMIATMILVWRVLSPIQTGFMSISRIEQVRSSIRQIDSLMALKPERDPKEMVAPIKRIKGLVTFSRVSLRYTQDTDPALVGATFQAEPGEIVCVVGPNGSGKSTVIKLITGMYQPQAGSVKIDNLDIRQLDPIELRHSIAYVPQAVNLFYGTIAQNLRLAHPTATDNELEWALSEAGAWEDIQDLPRGIFTRVGDGTSEQLPSSLIQKINLARAYVKRAPITLFDEPVNGLDFEGDQQFMRAVEKMRGYSTVFIVTHRPSHLKLADRILLFDGGYLRIAGPATEVRDKIPMDML